MFPSNSPIMMVEARSPQHICCSETAVWLQGRFQSWRGAGGMASASMDGRQTCKGCTGRSLLNREVASSFRTRPTPGFMGDILY